MDADAILTIILIISGLVGWVVQRARESGKQDKEPAAERELTLEEIFSDAPEMLEQVPDEVWENSPPAQEPAESQQVTADELSPSQSIPAPALPRLTDQPETMPLRGTRESEKGRVYTVAGIPINPQGIRQGIIISEVLGKPKSLRPPRQTNGDG